MNDVPLFSTLSRRIWAEGAGDLLETYFDRAHVTDVDLAYFLDPCIYFSVQAPWQSD